MVIVKVILICLLNVLFNKQIQSYQFSGDATSYGDPNGGNFDIGGFCGFKEDSFMSTSYESKFKVALNAEQWNNSFNCGRCVSIKYQDNTQITALISNKCPECKYGDLDLFGEAYGKIIKKSSGREKIQWDFINCPSEYINGNIKLRVDNINYYWLSINPTNFACGISKMEILFDSEWIEMDRNDDDTNKKNKMNGLFFIYHDFVKTPFQLRLTSMYNDIILSPKYDNIENILLTNQQFKCDGKNIQPECDLPMPIMTPISTSEPTNQSIINADEYILVSQCKCK